MSCNTCLKADIQLLTCCYVKIVGKGTYKVSKSEINEYGTTIFTNGGDFDIGNLTKIDGVNYPTSEIDAIICDWLSKCCSTDEDVERFNISHFDRCKDGIKVQFEACKNEETKETIYTGSDGSTFTDFAAITSAGYLVECIEKEYDCSEGTLTIPEGETYSYQDVLDYFNNNSTFDDGSVGAEGVKFLNFVNMEQQGMNFTYNGTSTTAPTAGQFQFGGQENNPISLDAVITSNCGDTTVTYIVYKCI